MIDQKKQVEKLVRIGSATICSDDKIIKVKKEAIEDPFRNFSSAYEIQLNEIYYWSQNIPFSGLTNPKNTSNNSVQLALSTDLSRYTKGVSKSFCTEEELLKEKQSSILIGNPGGGKTTTLKRLSIKFITDFEKIDFPFKGLLIIRLRTLRDGETVETAILNYLGIKYFTDHDKGVSVNVIGKTSASRFLPTLLNSLKLLIFLDGIDEVDIISKNRIYGEIKLLGIKLTDSKIIATIRSGEYLKSIEGFNTYEIKPLSNEKIVQISNSWLGIGNNFLNELNNKPYRDLANRPIFLTLLIILYDKNGYLPLKPFEVYKEATYLVIKDWDEMRNINRVSKYSNFNIRQKLNFLYDIAFELTYKIKVKTFDQFLLEKVYKSIHRKYDLPIDEMKDVIKEIESHNGIIQESISNNYEFSHLSIQEYLCAEHLVRLPYSKTLIRYFEEYPEPLAISICISGSPDEWLCNLLLNPILNLTGSKDTKKINNESSLYKIITRLLIESPNFNVTRELGYAIFFLLFTFVDNVQLMKKVSELIEYPNCKESMAMAIKDFDLVSQYKENDKFCTIHRNRGFNSDYFLQFPNDGKISTKLYNELSKI